LLFNLTKIFYKLLIIIGLLIGFHQVTNATILNLDKTSTKDQIKKMILVDASSLSRCQKESVKTAKCLPSNTFQSDLGVLASFYDITWVFGTAGLQGSEELLVFADTEKQRDALLGLLYLAGHKKLWRWNAKKSELQNVLGLGKGQRRGIIRSKYYIASMRDESLVLPHELEPLKKQGWVLSAENINKTQQTIIIGKKPLDALALFTRLFMQKTEKQLLKIFIYSPIKKLSAKEKPLAIENPS